MIAFYPGSFDPVTRGHLNIIRRALAFCPQLVVGIGQNNRKQTLFPVESRIAMLNQALAGMLDAVELARVTVLSYRGATIDQARQSGATLIVKGLREFSDYPFEERMGIVNRRLDASIDTVFLMTDNALRDVSSSAVKEMALAGIAPEKFHHYLTDEVRDALLARVKAEG